ncbi:hypothetical protein M408DRAFT_333341 [Serendipita vermifera MAFF 305830]|uniref:Peptidase A1 domain-containing protein n=1 Tax=Serendipita vermifera MAFF 305830 TaxID=933852 RepID=A0A0C2WWA1_SERVB|nr:hypothetical protein M408DRAFT_333341 [Serendipita vermifera MAFF 305830]
MHRYWLAAFLLIYSVSATTTAKREPVTIPLRRTPSSPQPNQKRAEAGPDIVRAVLQRDARRRVDLFGNNQEKKNNHERRQSWETLGISSYYGDALYYASVKIGTPPQTVDLLIDTGSTDLYVQSSTCRTCNLSLVQPYFDDSQSSFDASRSTSFTQLATQVQLSYADGSVVSGGVARDKITLGSFTVPNQTFILATSAQLSLGVAGIIGLGFPALARTNADPWWLNALDQFTEPEISIFLTQWRDSTGADLILPGGQMTLGGRNTSLFEEDKLVFTPIISERWWTIPIRSLLVAPPTGGTSTNTTLTLNGTYTSAVVDTGTTLIYGPSEIVRAFYAALPGTVAVDTVAPGIGLDGFYALPCNTTARAVFKFTNTSEFIFPATNLMWLGLSSYMPGYCVASLVSTNTLDNFSKVAGSSKFIGPIEGPSLKDDNGDGIDDETGGVVTPPTTVTNPSWLIGDAFLKSVYTVFRRGNGTAEDPASVGFAPIKGLNYAADGNVIIGVDTGADGVVGGAGVIVAGGGDILTSSSTTFSMLSATASNTSSAPIEAQTLSRNGASSMRVSGWGWMFAAAALFISA